MRLLTLHTSVRQNSFAHALEELAWTEPELRKTAQPGLFKAETPTAEALTASKKSLKELLHKAVDMIVEKSDLVEVQAAAMRSHVEEWRRRMGEHEHDVGDGPEFTGASVSDRN